MTYWVLDVEEKPATPAMLGRAALRDLERLLLPEALAAFKADATLMARLAQLPDAPKAKQDFLAAISVMALARPKL